MVVMNDYKRDNKTAGAGIKRLLVCRYYIIEWASARQGGSNRLPPK